MFSRTSSGIKNTDLFYRNQYIVWVEGQDDITFWGMFFPKQISGYECKFKPAGGSEINKYIENIYNDNAKFAVAMDSDYRLFMGNIFNHPQILETIAHSIENIIINPQSLAKIILINSRLEEYDIENIEKWFDYFNQSMHELMVADYIAKKKNLRVKCLGESCFRFLENEKAKSPYFSAEKINNFIQTLGLDHNEFTITKQEFKEHMPSRHIKGHFLFGSSLCFLNYEINRLRPNKVKRSVANEDFYAMLILCSQDLFSICLDLKELRDKAIQVAEKVVDLLST